MLFLVGLVVGGTLGMVIAALCTISAVEDAKAELEGIIGSGNQRGVKPDTPNPFIWGDPDGS